MFSSLSLLPIVWVVLFPGVSLSVGASSHVWRTLETCTVSAGGGDDAPALLAAIKSSECSTVVVPTSTTLNISTQLDMTAISNKHISVQGTLKFNPDITYWADRKLFIPFPNQSTFWGIGGSNILLDGGGILDGQGQVWYDAFASNSSVLRPIVLTIYQATNVTVKDLNIVNGPMWVNLVNDASQIYYRNINISSASISKNPAKNTDAWDTWKSDTVVIEDSIVNNSDDCVSFKSNSTNILVSNLACNGSHGISVGSLGATLGQYDLVENITATNIKLTNSQNGARIKAWAGPNVGSGLVKNVTFSYFTESNIDNPIVIDQCYFTNATQCAEYPSNTYIQDVWFNNVTGSSSGKQKAVVASLSCSPDGRCTNVNVEDISLIPPLKYGSPVYSCQNVVLEGNSADLFGTCITT